MGPPKSDVRNRLRSRRDAILPAERAEQSRRVAAVLTASRPWRQAGSVLLYRSIGSEVDTQPLFDTGWRDGKRLGAPRLSADQIQGVPVDMETRFRPGGFGVPEPEGPAAAPGAPWALVVVPGIAFDRAGHRLGYGSGYYDAFLARVAAGTTVGLAYRQTFVDALPVEGHDVPVQWVATPGGLHRSEP